MQKQNNKKLKMKKHNIELGYLIHLKQSLPPYLMSNSEHLRLVMM